MIENAIDALRACDPGCAREDWVKLAMAAKASGVDFDEFHDWSQGASNYSNERDVRSMWNSIKRLDGITEKTLFKMAADSGWLPPKAEKPQKRIERIVPHVTEVWNRSFKATENEPYIVAKQGSPDGLKVVPHGDRLTISRTSVAGWLMVPVRDWTGGTLSAQFIPPPGAGKKLNYTAPMGDGAFVVGKIDLAKPVYLVEGIGQAWACHAATGCASIVAFGWGRVRTVAQAAMRHHVGIRMVLVPDAGKEEDARKIARDLSVDYVVMPPAWPSNSDVNDLLQKDGADALRALLAAVQAPPEGDGAILVNGADIEAKPIAWLWHFWLAFGKMHILAGPPGAGKTTVALAMAATITIGGKWPDGSRCPIGNVMIWSGEDDPADTLIPRLIAMGADIKRVFFITGSRFDGEVQPFDPSRHMPQLLAQAARIGDVKLLIVDPVVSAVNGDSHKNAEVRKGLQPLVDLGSQLGAAVLGITHLSKGTVGRDPTERVTGSIAFSAVARIVLLAAKVKTEDGTDRRVLVRSKANIAPDDGGFEYHIEQTEPLPGIHTSAVSWGQSVEGSARDILAEPEEETEAQSGAKADAEEFLRELLICSTPTKTVQTEAKAAGHAWATVRRASEALGVKKRKGESGWYWQLSQSDVAQATCSLQNHEQHGQVEQVEQVGNGAIFPPPRHVAQDAQLAHLLKGEEPGQVAVSADVEEI
ncbi:AAA family ATPase [Variovorax sp. LARHSF232]